MKKRAISLFLLFVVIFLNACGGGGGGGGSAPPPVADSIAPSVSIAVTRGGNPVSSPVSGTVLVSATATDNIAVSKVEFYIDTVLKSTVSSAPYTYTWYTTTATNAAHSLTAMAYDAAGNVGTSLPLGPLTVNNSLSLSIVTNIVGNTATGTISLSGDPSPATINGVDLIVTAPSGATISSVTAIGGATGGLVSDFSDPLGRFITLVTGAPFGAGNILTVVYTNVPNGTSASEFGVILDSVWGTIGTSSGVLIQ